MEGNQNSIAIWNPIEGCKRNCLHCRAKLIAHRIGGHKSLEYWMAQDAPCETGELYILDTPMREVITDKVEPFPFMFDPTFHRYRLEELANYDAPMIILVCTAGDFMGEWIPDDWTKAVVRAAYAFRDHNYLFITKNPRRYSMFRKRPPNMLFGASVATKEDMKLLFDCSTLINYVDIDPISSDIGICDFILKRPGQLDWVVAALPSSVDVTSSQMDFVQGIVSLCADHHVPLFVNIKCEATKNRGKGTVNTLLGGLPREYPEVISKVFHKANRKQEG